MLVDVTKAEEEVLSGIRESRKYKEGNFEIRYIEFVAETRSIVEAAKMYIIDNYKKVNDYKTLHLMLRCANHEGTQYFGTKSKKKRGQSEIFNKLINELNDKTIEIKTFDAAVYDWTDGDFSVTLNGVNYNWIDSNSIIDIAAHIERKLDNGNKIL
jgi:hypothetical protein